MKLGVYEQIINDLFEEKISSLDQTRFYIGERPIAKNEVAKLLSMYLTNIFEQVLSEVDGGLVEAAQSMGLSPWEIIFSVYLKESIPGITRVTMITFVSFIGITAIAGAIGAGGLGDFAIRYGYQMGYRDMIWLTVIVILLMISIFQFIGNYIIKKTSH